MDNNALGALESPVTEIEMMAGLASDAVEKLAASLESVESKVIGENSEHAIFAAHQVLKMAKDLRTKFLAIAEGKGG